MIDSYYGELMHIIELAKTDFKTHHASSGEVVSELDLINGQEIIVLSDDNKKAYYAYKPFIKELEIVKVIRIGGI